ncbi:MAG TPA: phosphoribosyltransferase [Ktedonobacterales bacterium]|nr:phosphoribosyltransferase [Ktedonobacterales bacterium]
MPLHNRYEAGKLLAARLVAYAGTPGLLVLALPRGGVPVAFEVARALSAPLDVFLVRKLGVPGHEELALGAIASGGIRVLNADVLQMLDIPNDIIEAVTLREQHELARRERIYRDDRPALDARDRTIILVDDGLATGASMRAAIIALRERHPRRIVVAVPVAAAQTLDELRAEADDIVCLDTPDPFYGVGWWYEDFSQITDAEAHDLLTQTGSARLGKRHR